MNNYIIPAWPAPKNIKAYTTTRLGGYSQPPYHTFNLSLATCDYQELVLKNRAKLKQDLSLPENPFRLKQEHTSTVIMIGQDRLSTPVVADASYTKISGKICAVLTADCVPILVCDLDGKIVAAIHAGWKGIANGVVESTIKAMDSDPAKLLAWLGPAIGPKAFQVNEDLIEIFCNQDDQNRSAFTQINNDFFANIYQLASICLHRVGITKIYGGEYCTFTQDNLFYSYRRDGEKSGRMASLIWLESGPTHEKLVR